MGCTHGQRWWEGQIPYSGKFLYGANFCIFRMCLLCDKIKTMKVWTFKIFKMLKTMREPWPALHAANNVSLPVLSMRGPQWPIFLYEISKSPDSGMDFQIYDMISWFSIDFYMTSFWELISKVISWFLLCFLDFYIIVISWFQIDFSLIFMHFLQISVWFLHCSK